MPGGKTSFCNSWLQGFDSNGHKLNMVQKKSLFEAQCSLSDSTFSVANRGNDQILQHSSGKKHSAIANLRFDKTTQHLYFGQPSKQTSSHTKPHEKELALKESEVDRVKSAEVLRMLKVAESDYSLTPCDNIGKLFMQMFPGNICSQVQLGRSKASYVVSDGLSPCILDEAVKDIKNCGYRLYSDV